MFDGDRLDDVEDTTMHMISFDTAQQLARQHRDELLIEAEQRRAGRRRGGRRHWWSRRPMPSVAAWPPGPGTTSTDPIVTPLAPLPGTRAAVSDGIDRPRAA